MIDLIWKATLIGIGATALMDVWAVVLWKVFGEPRPNWRPVGRWLLNLPTGKVFHDNIADIHPFAGESVAGWVFHYLVGIVYGFVLVALVGTQWFANPTFLPAFLLGMVTIGAAWFFLQPALGAGWFASRTPNPWKVRALNIAAHSVFALGLYCTALLIRAL